MTNAEIGKAIREWVTPENARLVFASKETVHEWLDRLRWHVEWVSKMRPVDKGYLIDWYINSVGDEEPVWTEKHIEELVRDFGVYLTSSRDGEHAEND